MQEQLLIKKFYKDFSESENQYLEEILDIMCGREIEVPSYIYRRILERDIIDNDASLIIDENDRIIIPGIINIVTALESGIVYEISNEGAGHTRNPYRMVVAHQKNDEVLFVKIKPDARTPKTKIMDLWKIPGKNIPTYPPIRTIDQFDSNWDFVSEMEAFFRTQNNQHLVPAS